MEIRIMNKRQLPATVYDVTRQTHRKAHTILVNALDGINDFRSSTSGQFYGIVAVLACQFRHLLRYICHTYKRRIGCLSCKITKLY